MRVRVRFSKLGKVRWISHRDVARAWERAFRKASLPLAYTGGFSPRPKVSFGLALSTGYESVAEYLDVEVAPELSAADLDVATLPARLSPALPAGIDVLAAALVDDRAPSLQHDVTSCSWRIEAAGATWHEARDLVSQALAADSLVVTRERKGQTVNDDIRPDLVSLDVLHPTERGVLLEAELATQQRALRPSELLRALAPHLEEVDVRRTHQWIQRDGARAEPLPLDATDAPPASSSPSDPDVRKRAS